MVSHTEDVTVGFKMTALGPLPEEWQVVKLGEVATFTAKPRNLDITNQDIISFISMEGISDDGSGYCKYTLKSRSAISSGVYCEPGDVLIAKITPCLENGKQCIVQSDLPTRFAYATTEVYPLKPKLDIMDRSFLFAYLLCPPVRYELASKMEGTTGRQRLPKHVLSTLLFPLPPPPEQRAIARVLSTIQRAIEAQDKVISATCEFKKSLMRHLFTYGPVPISEADKVPLKETEIGPVPKEWGAVKLGDVTALNKLALDPQQYPDELFEYYSIPAYQVSDEPTIERGGQIHSQKLVVRAGAVLFGKLNPRVPKVWLVASSSSRKKIASTEFIPLTPVENRISSLFLYYLAWSNYVMPIAQELVSGSTPSRQRVDTRSFLKVVVPLPPLPEQQEIARILTVVDKRIEAEEKRKAALQTLFNTMLHLLMTGQLRVKDLEV